MTKKVIIRPVTPIGSEVMLTGAYPVKGVFRKFTPTYETIINPLTHDRQVDLTNKRDFIFNNTVTEITLEYDEEAAKDKMSTDFAIKESIETFFKHHPNVLVDGQPHDNTPKGHKPEFVLEIVSERAQQRVNALQAKTTVIQHIMKMSRDTKANVMDFFGISPVGMTDNDILVYLVDLQSGILIKDDQKLKQFTDAWMGDVSHETELTLNIRKALRLNIITRKPNGQREDYYFKGTHIGFSPEDCITYFRQNSGIYDNFVLREVAEKTASEKEVPATKAKPSIPVTEDIIQLRLEVNRLKEAGFIHGKIYNPTMVNKMTDPAKLRTLVEEGKKNEEMGNKVQGEQLIVGDTGAPQE